MNKIFSLTLMCLTAFVLMSCSKDDDNSTDYIANSKRLVKSISYDQNDEVLYTIEWTYKDNYSCSIKTDKNGGKVKVENFEGSNNILRQQYNWQNGDWVMTYEEKSVLDASKRIVSNETTISNPSIYRIQSTYTYSGDSTIIVGYRNSSEPTDKIVQVERGDEHETISYTYLGNNQWEETIYEKIVTTYTDSKKNKPSSVITYNRSGDVTNRRDYEWSGENCKVYTTIGNVKYLLEEMTIDGTTSTEVHYYIDWDGSGNSLPAQKTITKKIGNMTEKCMYYMVEEEWKLHNKDVDYYEEVEK